MSQLQLPLHWEVNKLAGRFGRMVGGALLFRVPLPLIGRLSVDLGDLAKVLLDHPWASIPGYAQVTGRGRED